MTLNPILIPSRVLQHPWPEVAGLILLPYVYIVYPRLVLRRQNEFSRVVSENAADMIALVEITGKWLHNSPVYERVLAYSSQELAVTGSLE